MDRKIFIGRTTAFYEPNEDSLYVENTWTWSEDASDEEFAGEVYELNEEAVRELDWWCRCQRMNGYERRNSWNPDTRTAEEIWESLIQQSKLIKS